MGKLGVGVAPLAESFAVLVVRRIGMKGPRQPAICPLHFGARRSRREAEHSPGIALARKENEPGGEQILCPYAAIAEGDAKSQLGPRVESPPLRTSAERGDGVGPVREQPSLARRVGCR